MIFSEKITERHVQRNLPREGFKRPDSHFFSFFEQNSQSNCKKQQLFFHFPRIYK
jgi:hypothetical protein